MLGRLRITQRLSLLLMLPLAAVVLISVPFTVERVDEARSSASIVTSAMDAQVVGEVILELQQERLLALGRLTNPALSRPAIVAQNQSTMDSIARARSAVSGPAAPALSAVLAAFDRLSALRQAVLDRRSSASEVYRAYATAVADLINALRLGEQPGADAIGVRQMSSLDALLRANEQTDQLGAALMVAAVDPADARAFAMTAVPLRQAYLDNFRQLGSPDHVDLLGRVGRGPATTDLNVMVAALTAGDPAARTVEASLAAAQSAIVVTRAAQDRIVRDIAAAADRRAGLAATAAYVVALIAAVLLLLVVWLGVAVSRSVGRPLRRVTLAATAVADLAAAELVRASEADFEQEGPPKLAALNLRTADEVGELASAFNRVQATAALLMEQQVTTRRNVAVMFANIAHRTQSLVARQLAQIDTLERNERDEERLVSLYRLDHLTARLRRSADSLLVISGSREDNRLVAPTALTEVIRSATAEVEDYQAVQLEAIADATIPASLVPDLTLLLAELLENATAFSPPGVPVNVSARLDSGCLIRIVDHGIGMGADRLAEENRRLVARERLDVAPSTMLGLFVVGRLARRHGIDVRLVTTAVTGVTAEVYLPGEVLLAAPPDLTPATGRAPVAIAQPPHRQPPQAPARQDLPPPDRPRHHQPGLSPAPRLTVPAGDFGWFDPYQSAPHPSAAAVNGSHSAAGDPSRGGLRRRQPGQGISGLEPSSVRRATTPTTRDPQAERAAMNAFAAGDARAGADATGQPSHVADLPHRRPPERRDPAPMGQPPPPATAAAPSGHGLRRRRPGEHLAESLRAETPRHAMRSPDAWDGRSTMSRTRDAEAERDQLVGYLDGLARADAPTELPHDPWSR